MKNFLLPLLLLPFLASSQITVCDEDTVPITGFSIPTLRPVILCPFDTGFVFFWQMSQPGGGGDGAYFHSMSPFTDGAYHLGVDDSHLLTPATGWCFICVEGTNYNAVADAWGVADSSGGITPAPNCSMVPDYTYTEGWPDRFTYNTYDHSVVKGRWTVILSNQATFTYTPPYFYQTPNFSGYPFYNTYTSLPPYLPYQYVHVWYGFKNGTSCRETYDLSLMRIAGPQELPMFDLNGRAVENPEGFYIQNRQLKFRN